MVITTSMLKNKYKDFANPLDKIKRDADGGQLIRLTRGVYETDSGVNPCFLASSILSPSYLSFDWALSFYGLIPERVVSITSASLNLRKNKTFINKFARYEYSDIPVAAFSEGLTYIESGDYVSKIATKEKAICDSLCKWRVVRNIKDLKELLFVDKRIDEEEFSNCDFTLMIRLASLYKKTNLDLLTKLIKKEYLTINKSVCSNEAKEVQRIEGHYYQEEKRKEKQFQTLIDQYQKEVKEYVDSLSLDELKDQLFKNLMSIKYDNAYREVYDEDDI